MADIANYRIMQLPPTILRGTVDTFYVSRRWVGIYAGPDIFYLNRVWDTVAGGFVSWRSLAPDTTGERYPGPGVFGVSTSDYVVERTTYPER